MSIDINLVVDVDTGGSGLYRVRLYESNYTHNVGPMWSLAGIHHALYHSGGRIAGDLIPELTAGAEKMHADPDAYIALNPSNGWGDYWGAYDFVRNLLAACEQHPKAIVEVSA
jgi:hypothetical protein